MAKRNSKDGPRFIEVVNWRRAQPTMTGDHNAWLKLYTSLLDHDGFRSLDNDGRMLIVALWLYAAYSGRHIFPADPKWLKGHIPLIEGDVDLGPLLDARDAYGRPTPFVAYCDPPAATEDKAPRKKAVKKAAKKTAKKAAVKKPAAKRAAKPKTKKDQSRVDQSRVEQRREEKREEKRRASTTGVADGRKRKRKQDGQRPEADDRVEHPIGVEQTTTSPPASTPPSEPGPQPGPQEPPEATQEGSGRTTSMPVGSSTTAPPRDSSDPHVIRLDHAAAMVLDMEAAPFAEEVFRELRCPYDEDSREYAREIGCFEGRWLAAIQAGVRGMALQELRHKAVADAV